MGAGRGGRLHARQLVSKARGCLGLTALSSAKKRPFLSDGGYLRHRGFQLADTAKPYFELLYLPFEADAPRPRFSARAREGETNLPGLVLCFSDQCPHAEKYARLAEAAAERHGRTLTLVKFETTEDARRAPSPFTTYSLFLDGQFVTNEILSEQKFLKLLEEHAPDGIG